MKTSTCSTSKKQTSTTSIPMPHLIHGLPPQIPPEHLYIAPNLPPDELPYAFEYTWRGHEPDILPDPTFSQGDANSCSYITAVKVCASTIALDNNEKVTPMSSQVLIDNMETFYPEACIRRVPNKAGVVWSSRVVYSLMYLMERGAPYVARVQIPAPAYPPTGRILRLQGFKVYEVKDVENREDIKLGKIQEIPEGGGDAITNLIKAGPIVGEMSAYPSSFSNYKKGIYEGRKPPILKEGNKLFGHALLVVGFGRTRPGREYFVCQNSYGKAYGRGGYYRIKRSLFWGFLVPLGPRIEVPEVEPEPEAE